MLDVLGIWFHHELNLFICRACQVCLTWDVVKGHCKGHHQLAISPQALEELQVFGQHHQVYRHPEEVPLPQPGGPVVQGLSALEMGFACGTTGCRYSVKDEGRMRKHQQSEHRQGGPMQPLTHRICQVQTLFQGIGKAYFEVNLKGSMNDSEGQCELLLQALKQVGVSSDRDQEAAIAMDKD